jgi:alternate signal-mediated exported protein
MNKSTKGAIAAAGAGVLLLGGAGTLAFWNDTDTLNGGTLTAGTLDLSDVTCGANWLEGGNPVAVIVPGDTVTKECTGTITLTGDHIEADVTLDSASVATAEAAFNDAAPDAVAGDAVDITAGLTGGGTITASGAISVTITVTWPYGTIADNESQGVSTSALDGLVINAVQVDPHP